MRILGLGILCLLLAGCSSAGSIGGTPPQYVQTTLVLSQTDSMPTVGKSTTVTAGIVPATATGTVSLAEVSDLSGDKTAMASGTLAAGTTTLSFQPGHAGLNIFTASYGGSNGYDPSVASLQIFVRTPVSAANCGLGDATFLLDSGSEAPSQTSFSSTNADQSAVCAQNTGTTLTLNSPVITKSGWNISYDRDDPSGVDAAVLAYGSSASSASGATINLEGSPSISVQGGGYAAFASGLGSVVNLDNATVSTNSEFAIGAGNNGEIDSQNTSVTTGYELMAIVDGGSATLTNTSLTSTYGGPTFGVGQDGHIWLIGPASGAPVTTGFAMTGGSITTNGTAFVVQGNQNATVYLSGVSLSGFSDDSGAFLSGSVTEGSVNLTLDNEHVIGSISSNALQLQNGSVFSGDYLGGGSLSLDASSSMTMHGTVSVTYFSDPGGISGSQILNINGNGQTLHYSKALNPQLGGLTYNLQGSGTLAPY